MSNIAHCLTKIKMGNNLSGWYGRTTFAITARHFLVILLFLLRRSARSKILGVYPTRNNCELSISEEYNCRLISLCPFVTFSLAKRLDLLSTELVLIRSFAKVVFHKHLKRFVLNSRLTKQSQQDARKYCPHMQRKTVKTLVQATQNANVLSITQRLL